MKSKSLYRLIYLRFEERTAAPPSARVNTDSEDRSQGRGSLECLATPCGLYFLLASTKIPPSL